MLWSLLVFLSERESDFLCSLSSWFGVLLKWSHFLGLTVIKGLALLGFVSLAFTKFGGEDATASDKFKVSSEKVSVVAATEILLTPFEPLIGF